MPSLFPTEEVQVQTTPEVAVRRSVKFGRSWMFDWDAGEFVLDSTGRVVEAEGTSAWLAWCKKALMTTRYRYLVYSRAFGQEFDDLIAKHLTSAANEAEIKRITTETLMMNPRTASVDNFSFLWNGDAVYFTCEVRNVLGESGRISGSVVVG